MTSEDLAARLRDWKNVWLQDSDQPDGSLYIEAADALAAAQEENERLREALEWYQRQVADFAEDRGGSDIDHAAMNLRSDGGDKARAALGEEG